MKIFRVTFFSILAINLGLLIANDSCRKDSNKSDSNVPQEKIINLSRKSNGMGGIESHLLVFNKVFGSYNIPTQIITNGDLMVRYTHQKGFPYGLPSICFKNNGMFAEPQDIIDCNPGVVICNWIEEIKNALNAKKTIPIKVVYVHHNSLNNEIPQNINLLSQCDGIVVIDPRVKEYLNKLFAENNSKVPKIENISPFFDAGKFLNFQQKRTKKEYFVQEYGIAITDESVMITMIANMLDYKNHQLLLEALSLLKKQSHKKFNVFLAGEGPLLEKHKKTVCALNLDSFVHFLGPVVNIPELLNCSDIHLLTSCDESFGIVHAEAAFMKKPFIASNSTAIASRIQQGINGFIFKNNDAADLANKLEYLLDNPCELKKIGEKAHNYALENFSPEVLFAKWLNFLSSI